MRTLLFFLTFASLHAAATSALTDVSYAFDTERVFYANSTAHFFTAFGEYYYLLLDANRSQLTTVAALDQTGGWCVGDAHPENFGALILKNGHSIFTINDMDDAGPCPLVMDLLRF